MPPYPPLYKLRFLILNVREQILGIGVGGEVFQTRSAVDAAIQKTGGPPRKRRHAGDFREAILIPISVFWRSGEGERKRRDGGGRSSSNRE
ncbi:hypothetical protein EW146_g9815 [Bondarzewia mesenterica]|uniref:Uncharacterized protein n=1 Tax=Bondarzewia mesenterica TaxID=1095465 RepID=A0A4S4L300_9AGAM|nr:hypothetical protein EW146_g9815 [Bondarzewia mesenterica]